jgi:mono/diheme cytochrome c family protein
MTHRIRAAAVILLAASMAGTAVAQTGADIYKTKCARCHGDDGLATTPAARSMQIRSVKAPEMMKVSDAQLFAFIKQAYKNYGLADAQIKDVVAYIRKLQKQ